MKEEKMDVYDTISLILLANSGSMNGRTTLLKLAYLSSSYLHLEEVSSYKAHYYGPYSPKLSIAMEMMISHSFIDEIITPGATLQKYQYKLTSDGEEFAEMAKQNHPKEFEKIKGVIKECDEFCKLETNPLSYATKILYIYKQPQGKEMTTKDMVLEADDLGWGMKEKDIKQSIGLLQKLKLVQ